MINKITKIIFIVLFLAVNNVIAQSEGSHKETAKSVEISAILSGTAFVTNNLESSVKFYTEFLGFQERKRINIDTPNGKAVFGVSGGGDLPYAALVPAVFSKENPNFPGLNFIEINDSKSSPFSQDGKRDPIAAEIVMAYAVKGLDEIEKRMCAADVKIVTPVALSATGKSKTLTVIDPNGIRIQMYEYVKK